MPQHPVYDSDPNVSLSELADLADALVKYGLGHEDVIYPIQESVIAELYPEAAKAAVERAHDSL